MSHLSRRARAYITAYILILPPIMIFSTWLLTTEAWYVGAVLWLMTLPSLYSFYRFARGGE